MAENEFNLPTNSNSVQDWAQKNPLQALLVSILTMVVLSFTTSLITTKSAAQNTSVNTENLATKQDKDEIWRYMNGRVQIRDNQFADIRSNMATKAEIEGLRDLIKASDAKYDTSIRMLTDQNKLLQEFIQATRK